VLSDELVEVIDVALDHAGLAAVVQELESQPSVQEFLSSQEPSRRKRFGKVIAIVVRMTMDRLGWEVVSHRVGRG